MSLRIIFTHLNLTNSHKALLLSIAFVGVLIIALFSFKMNQEHKQKELLMELDIEEQLAQIKEQEELPPKPQTTKITKSVTNEAFNESEQVTDEDFESRMQDIIERNAEQREALESSNSSGSADLDSGQGNAKETSKPISKANAKQTTSKYKSNRRSNISYYLPTRDKVKIPNPIYTCDQEGTVVINITVNEYGLVTKTDYNRSQSTTSNGCLVDEALYYAERARFSEDASKDNQKGTITYQFQN